MPAALVVVLLTGLVPAGSAGAQSYQRISGEGSSWAAGAIDAMRVNVKQFGITVDYNPSGSSAGRKSYLSGTVDFAASDIPFQFRPEDGSAPENPAPGSYAYIPVTAGGTSFMYNLKINGQRVTNLRLSGQNVAKIFTGVISKWNDPALAADNPGLSLPDRKVVPVVRSDGSGSSAQFTKWMISQHGGTWNDYCQRSGRAPKCGFTSQYPVLTSAGMIAQSGDLGVAGYVQQGFAEGAIGYVNYSYALGAGFPVAKVLNAAGYYTEPTPENVAVSLLKARINTDETSDEYLTQQLEGVYTDGDARNYSLSSYSYFIIPTKVQGQFNTEKGRTLGAFTYYAMCQAQQQSASLGYSPMPINLVEASFDQIRKIPGVVVQDIDIAQCKNPTFSADGTNVLAKNAPVPQECDKQGAAQCATGTGGARTATAVRTAGASPAGAAAQGAAAAASGQAAAAGPAAAGAPGARAATGGTTGARTAGSGGTRSGAGGAAGAAAGRNSGAAACDADTGECGSEQQLTLGVVPVDGDAAADAAPASAVSTVLAGSQGWSAPQTLTVVVLLLTLSLVFAPAWAWHRLSGGRRP